MNKVSQLRKAMEHENDQCLTTGLSVLVPSEPVVAYTSIPKVQIPAVVDFSAHGLSHSPSSTKRGWVDITSTPVERGSPTSAYLVKGGDKDALTYFFRLPDILPSRVPSTPKEFVVVVAVEDLDFIRGLFGNDRRILILDDSRTLFRVQSLVFTVANTKDYVLGSAELSWE